MTTKSLLTFMFLCTTYIVHGQSTVRGSVFDAQDKSPLTYVHVSVGNSGSGTISNADGVFILDGVSDSDTVEFSYIGYEALYLTAAQIKAQPEVLMSQFDIELTEVFVTSEKSDRLYEILDECRAVMRKQPKQRSKAYFFLETTANDLPIEMMQCYYNASVESAAITELEYKNGRAGLRDFEGGGSYISLSTTKAVAMLDILNEHEDFPLNPFQGKRKSNLDNYQLQMLSSLSDTNTYHIKFTPIGNESKLFEGECWIDRSTMALKKIILRNPDASRAPFTPLDSDSRISRAGFDITQSYRMIDGKAYLDYIDFTYNLGMEFQAERQTGVLDIWTQGLFYFYDREDLFSPPLYDLDEVRSDYEMISVTPYDPGFWDSNWEFTFSALQLRRMEFLQQKGVLVNFKDEGIGGYPHLQNLKQWSPERVTLGISSEDTAPSRSTTSSANSYSARLFQLYLDVNQRDGIYQFTSSSITDISWYRLRPLPPVEQDCYFNMCFDLVEIERRNMMSALEESGYSTDAIERIYKKYSSRARQVANEFKRDTVKAKKKKKLLKRWNAQIIEGLGIDNLELFGLE